MFLFYKKIRIISTTILRLGSIDRRRYP